MVSLSIVQAISSQLGVCELKPSASLDVWRRCLRPADAKIRVLAGDRNQTLKGVQTSALTLTYDFSLDSKVCHACKHVTFLFLTCDVR